MYVIKRGDKFWDSAWTPRMRVYDTIKSASCSLTQGRRYGVDIAGAEICEISITVGDCVKKDNTQYVLSNKRIPHLPKPYYQVRWHGLLETAIVCPDYTGRLPKNAIPYNPIIHKFDWNHD